MLKYPKPTQNLNTIADESLLCDIFNFKISLTDCLIQNLFLADSVILQCSKVTQYYVKYTVGVVEEDNY